MMYIIKKLAYFVLLAEFLKGAMGNLQGDLRLSSKNSNDNLRFLNWVRYMILLGFTKNLK